MVGFYERFAEPEKVAFWGALARMAPRAAPAAASAGRAALNVGKGMMGVPLAQNATRGAQMAHNVGTGVGAINTAKGLYDSVKPPEPPPAPPGVRPGMKVGSLEARLLRLVRTKLAFGVQDAINVGSYGAMIGATLLPHKHPWHTYLEGAGLVGLGGTTLASMVGDPAERKPGLKDLAGLALFGSALYDRYKHPSEGGH